MTCLEVEAVAARALKGRLLNDASYNTLLSSFARDLRRVTVIPVSTFTVLTAIDHTRAHALRPADAMHFATAWEARSFFGETDSILVASDRELLSACDATGIDSLDPEADDAMKQLQKFRER